MSFGKLTTNDPGVEPPRGYYKNPTKNRFPLRLFHSQLQINRIVTEPLRPVNTSFADNVATLDGRGELPGQAKESVRELLNPLVL